MQFKTIALVIQSIDDIGPLLDFAIPHAENGQGHVLGIHAEPIPVAYSASVGFPDVAFIESSEDAAAKRASALATAFAARLQGVSLSHEWHGLRSMSGDSGASGAVIARSADLVVVIQKALGSEGPDPASIDPLVQDSGRPLLVLTERAAKRRFGRILVAWNGSREAARAAHDALPFIKAAAHTEILVIDPVEDGEESGANGALLAATLARHGASVSVQTASSGGDSVEEALQARAAEIGADLLVLGATSTSWLRQFFFGGVARNVVKGTPLPVLLSR